MLENMPSITAYAVAVSVLKVGKDPKFSCLVSPKAIPLLEAFVSEWRAQFQPWMKTHSVQLGAIVTPTTLAVEEHCAARKKIIEQEVMLAIKNGAGNVVNISAGLDTLALRLCEGFPSVDFVEIDHPATQNVKLKALKRLKYENPRNLRFHPANFDEVSLKDALQTLGINNQKKSVFVIEGVTMYLTVEQMNDLLQSVHAASPDSSVVIAGIISETDIRSLNDQKGESLKRALSNANEKYNFSVPFTEVPAFMYEKGFRVVRQATMIDLQRDVQPPDVLMQMRKQTPNENYFVAEQFDPAKPPGLIPSDEIPILRIEGIKAAQEVKK